MVQQSNIWTRSVPSSSLRPYTVTVPRGQESSLPFPMATRKSIRGVGGARGVADYSGVIAQMQKASEEARRMNELRYEQAMEIYRGIEKMYAPGGTFGAGYEAQLATQKKRDVASEIAQSISSGMYGTTIPGTAGMRWEETVGAPARLKLEDIRMERLGQAKQARAGFIERREDVYPNWANVANLMIRAYGG